MKMRKLSLVTAMLLTASLVFSACGGNTETSSSTDTAKTSVATDTTKTSDTASKLDTSKEVKLKMYLVGDKEPDADLVYAEVSKKLKADINATLETNYLSWAENTQKYPLIFASGEDFDLVYAASWNKYKEQAVKNAFMDISDEMLKTYAPKTFEETPKTVWDQVGYNGKRFMIPSLKQSFYTNVAIIRGDLRAKYNLPEIKSVEDVETYLEGIAKNEKEILPWADMNYGNAFRLEYMFVDFENLYNPISGCASGVFKQDDKTGKIYSWLDKEYYDQQLAFYKKMTEWYNKNFWSKSALSSKTPEDQNFKAGKSALMSGNIENMQKVVDEVNKNHPDWKPEIYDLNFTKNAAVQPYTQNGICINANSKNPERALMALELLRYDQSYFDLAAYGIKDKHYDLDADGKLLMAAETKNYRPDTQCPWGFKTSSNVRTMATQLPSVDAINKSFESRQLIPALSGFSFDGKDLKNETAAMIQINDQYRQLLALGMDSNPEARLKEWVSKLKTVGLEKYVAEVQRQMDEYVKTLAK